MKNHRPGRKLGKICPSAVCPLWKCGECDLDGSAILTDECAHNAEKITIFGVISFLIHANRVGGFFKSEEADLALVSVSVSVLPCRARSSCWKKCIHGFAENELGAAESACIERCVLKYIEVQEKNSPTFLSFWSRSDRPFFPTFPQVQQLLSGRMAMTGQAMEEQMRAAGGQMPGMPPK